jgi:uncharacterized protein YjbI with pentapeptide repeats
MANKEHLARLKQGVEAWNQWREAANPDIQADLHGADLRNADLAGADLAGADLAGADLREADLTGAHLTGAHLFSADLFGVDLAGADLSRTNLSSAILERALLIQTNLEEADLTGCTVYGTSTWDLQLNDKTEQKSLVISRRGHPSITVDNIEVAQFIYLLLNNQKIRGIINTIAEKAVLILGRFTPERKAVLDAVREALRQYV